MSAPKTIWLDVCLIDYMFQTIRQMVMVGPTTLKINEWMNDEFVLLAGRSL